MNMLSKTYKPYSIVVVPFPFSDKVAHKKRPAVVLNTEESQTVSHAVLCAMITTTSSTWPGLDISITGLTSAGLPKQSKIRLKPFTLDQTLILDERGKLCPKDQLTLQKTLHTFCHLEGSV